MGQSSGWNMPHHDKTSKVSVDVNQFQKEQFNGIMNDNQFQQAINCDDIFYCNDRDNVNGATSEYGGGGKSISNNNVRRYGFPS